jgi:hypothetical protein
MTQQAKGSPKKAKQPALLKRFVPFMGEKAKPH